MPAPGVLLIVTVVLIVLALVFFLVSTIVALKQITDGLDETIASVVEIIEKSAPVNDVVVDINTNLDVAVGALEGLLVKKAGMVDAIGLVDGLYPGAGAVGLLVACFPAMRRPTSRQTANSSMRMLSFCDNVMCNCGMPTTSVSFRKVSFRKRWMA